MLHTYDVKFEDGTRDEYFRSTDENAETVMAHENREVCLKWAGKPTNIHGRIVSAMKVN